MKIFVNDKETALEEDVSVRQFLIEQNYDPEKVLVSVNDRILERNDYDNIHLNDGDKLDLMTFVGGG